MIVSKSIAEKLNGCIQGMGFAPQKVYYENTAFFLGYKIHNAAFELVYRLEEDVLLICSLTTQSPRQGLSTVLLPVLELWREIKPEISEVNKIKAMIGRTGGAEACEVRQKMVAFLQRQGTAVFVDDNEQWIEISR